MPDRGKAPRFPLLCRMFRLSLSVGRGGLSHFSVLLTLLSQPYLKGEHRIWPHSFCLMTSIVVLDCSHIVSSANLALPFQPCLFHHGERDMAEEAVRSWREGQCSHERLMVYCGHDYE